jgi:hypothetical protein
MLLNSRGLESLSVELRTTDCFNSITAVRMRFIGLSLPLQKVTLFLFLENGVVLTQLCGSSAFKVAIRIDFQ